MDIRIGHKVIQFIDIMSRCRKKERKSLTGGHVEGIGSTVGMQPYSGGVGV